MEEERGSSYDNLRSCARKAKTPTPDPWPPALNNKERKLAQRKQRVQNVEPRNKGSKVWTSEPMAPRLGGFAFLAQQLRSKDAQRRASFGGSSGLAILLCCAKPFGAPRYRQYEIPALGSGLRPCANAQRSPSARAMSRNEEVALKFLNALAAASGGCPATERLILQILPGDPGEAADNAWRPRPWRPGEDLPASPERTNGYVAISSFGRAPDNSWRRQKALFARGRMIMIDDVGTKVPRENAERLPPTWKVLTSVLDGVRNEQWIYLLDKGALHREGMDSVLDGLVAQALAPQDAKDPGMKGVTRVARIPGFINGKPKYGGNFRVRWLKGPEGFGEEELEGRAYTLDEIRKAFDLKATEYRAQERTSTLPFDNATREERSRTFKLAMKMARQYGLLENGKENAGGWARVRCPWEHEHTSSKDGADIRVPADENEWTGAFKCFHGHCDGRGWREFTDKMDELIAADLAAGNAHWKQIDWS